MGGNWSSLEREPSPDPWWPTPQPQSDTIAADQNVQKEEATDTTGGVSEERRPKSRVKQEELEKFKEELACKRALRQEALSALQAELLELRNRVVQSDGLERELEELREENKKLSLEKEKLMEEVEHKAALEKQIQALKDVSAIGKEMLRIRELQVKELKKKLVEINISSVTAPPEDLRIEYEKQIENIRKLRTLYEERAAATLLEHRRQLEREEARIIVLETKLSELQKETDECKDAKKDLEEKIEKLENVIQTKENELESTKDKLCSLTIQNKSLNSQIKLINNLFSQMLVNPKVDLDRLIRLLNENHGLITDLTENGDSNEVAGLLVDLASQVEKENEEKNHEQTISGDTMEKSDEETKENEDENENSQLKIASNLSKVWKVMIELLSHHQNSNQIEISGGAESCYKSIQTPSGPRSVISVSQTFITLKDLILEKNRLVKEVGRLKTLNSHLEHRLGSQEKRLLVVTSELRKTWGVVNKLKAQHKQLHTHEKILRYELQQKRCMLNELKLELDHCRDKWEQARQKNSQTEEDWKKLRKEFAARKSRKESNSAESGYEEDDIEQSPPSEPISSGEGLFVIRKSERSETELSEEDMEHSDGNSFDTVIDLLDIACIENQADGETEVPFVLCEAPAETQQISPSLLPLSGSEFTEGLDQIESEDLAAVLDVQYQTQLLGADYNLSLPSSSGSSPIPTENDDFASSEMDISEEDSSAKDNHVYTTPLPVMNQSISEGELLFGSNSSTNISKFLEGLFTEHENSANEMSTSQNLHLTLPSTSQKDENGSTTPIVNNENCYQFPNCNPYPQTETVSEESKSESQSLFPDTSSAIKYECVIASTSQNSSEANKSTIQEASLRAREDRLKKLEKQCRSLVTKVMSTSFKSDVLSNKLDELHLFHSSSEEDPNVMEGSSSDFKDTNISFYQRDEAKSSNNSCEVNSSTTPEKTSFKTNTEIEESVNMTDVGNISQSHCLEINPEGTLEVGAEQPQRHDNQCNVLLIKIPAPSSLSSKKLDENNSSATSIASTEPPRESGSNANSVNTAQKMIQISHDPKFESENVQKTEQLTKDENHLELHDIDSKSKAILDQFSCAGPQLEPLSSASNDGTKTSRTPEQILVARAERFKRLEEQCKSLVSKMTATSLRSEIISNKLDELHSCYGSTDSSSGSDEHSTKSSEGNMRSSPTSSSGHNKILLCEVEKGNSKEQTVSANCSTSQKSTDERVNLTVTPQLQSESNGCSTSDIADRSKETPEDILLARAQRLNRLEEQCKSLFSKISATSHRSNVISNKLEELHEQYGQPSTSQNGERKTKPSQSVAADDPRKPSHPHDLESDEGEINCSPSTSSKGEQPE